jgi:predicted AlkP superfamily phosphohydrolase/phosphomutase
MRRGAVLVFALDAGDPATVAALAASGRLPAFRDVLARAARIPVRNPPGIYVGALWPSFATGRTAARSGYHCWAEVAPGTYAVRDVGPDAVRGEPFWEALDRAGRRVAVLDVPRSRLAARFAGIQVVEYATHDRAVGFGTWPPSLRGEIERRFGAPFGGADRPPDGRSIAPSDVLHRRGATRDADEMAALVHDERAALEGSIALSEDCLARGPWDLFLTVFGAPHSIGHQCWHLHDPAHPDWDPVTAERLGDPVETAYRRLDASLATHLRAVRPGDLVLVLLSHGMAPLYTGHHVLEAVLARLDGEGTWYVVPSGTPASGIRINLAGREPRGVVPAARFDAACDELAQALGELVDVATGRPVVASVVRVADHVTRSPDDTLPDLVVTWSRHGRIDAVRSPRIGELAGRFVFWRTGDHLPEGLLLACGDGVQAGALLPPIGIEDVAPTIAARLGVALDDVDGLPIDALTSAPPSTRPRC